MRAVGVNAYQTTRCIFKRACERDDPTKRKFIGIRGWFWSPLE